MRRVHLAILTVVVFALAAFGAMSLMAPDVEAVGCPPPSGPVSGPFCGGIAGVECPGNMQCVDDPRDNCCPQTGGADCSGICVSPNRER